MTFPIFDGGTRSLKKRLIASATGGHIAIDAKQHLGIQALQNINLDLSNGARVGLVGHNGAGKSTLLRVLAGIYEPQLGKVTISGKIATLLDLDLGMDHMSTGYENILLRGLFLGLSRREIHARTAEIAEFSELGSFLDMPLHTYSAGMLARLAFSISTCVAPEILLLDEGIGASDAVFISKARKRLANFANQASIVVIASHTESLLRDLCEQLIFMEHGEILAQGSVEDILKLMNSKKQALR